MNIPEEYLSAEEKQLRAKLNAGFGNLKNAVLEKRQFGKTGRAVYLPLMATVATGIYTVCAVFMSWINVEYRILGMVVGTAVYAFFLLRFCLSFVTDLRTQKHAERIFYLSEGGKRYAYGEGLYVKKLESADGNLVCWGKENQNYEKYSDKNVLSPLASRYDRHLQRRSCNLAILTAEFWIDKLRQGSFSVQENRIDAINGDGEFCLTFDGNGAISTIHLKGAADVFFDSASPIHLYNAKLPFDYTVDYRFCSVNAHDFTMYVPDVFLAARKDYLLSPILADSIRFTAKATAEEKTKGN